MEVTTVEAKRPDVNLRLSAEEADVLRAYFGELNKEIISEAFKDFDEDAAEDRSLGHLMSVCTFAASRNASPVASAATKVISGQRSGASFGRKRMLK